MIYLAKLARRLSRIKTLAPVLLLGAACSAGEKGDFLGPDPSLIHPPLVSVRLSPQVATVQANQVFQFRAIGITEEGREVPANVDWYTTSGGWVSSNGQFTAEYSGQYRIRIQVRSNEQLRDSATAGVWSKPSDVLFITVDPDSTDLYVDEGVDLDAYTKLADGTIKKTDAVIWSASGGTIDASGWFTASASADYTVTAVAGNGVSGKSKIKVRQKRAVSLLPSLVSLAPGDSQQFTVSGTNGTTPSVDWTATGGTISSSGMYTAGAATGSFAVVATQTGGTAADTSNVTIGASAPTLTSITILPATLSLQTGGTRQFTATGQWSDGSTGTVPVTWTATGGTITATGLYAAGNTAGTFRVVGTQIGGGKADTTTVTITSAPVLTGVVLTPASASMYTGGSAQFTAVGTYSNGGNAVIPLTWSATGGTVTSSGVYTAGGTAGSFRVVAKDQASPLADTASVTILLAPPPGQYTTIARQDWKTYADKAALAGMIGVEAGLNTEAPALPVTDFYDLVQDPIFGKVVRYNGGPQLNIADRTRPGRTAVHTADLNKKAKPNATWWSPNGTWNNYEWFPTDIWVRQYIRFSTNWTPIAAYGGQGAPSYKAMFLRYWNSSARHEFDVDGPRGVFHSIGNPGLTKVNEGTLPWNNVLTMNDQYGTQGWPFPDFYPAIWAPGPYPSSPYGAPYGNGDGEWYEIVLHHKAAGNRGEASMYWRKYTVNGMINPQPWKIHARFLDVQAGQSFVGISNYQMGINRNRGYDVPMFIYWGPYEVVDGSTYPNPWGLPGG